MAKKAAIQEVLDQAKAAGEQAAAIPEGFTPVSSGFELNNDGDTLQGLFLGFGKDREVGKGKKKKVTKTFNVRRNDGAEVNVLVSAQLETFLSARKPGKSEIFIRRLGQVRGGQGRVNQFQMAFRDLSDSEAGTYAK